MDFLPDLRLHPFQLHAVIIVLWRVARKYLTQRNILYTEAVIAMRRTHKSPSEHSNELKGTDIGIRRLMIGFFFRKQNTK